MRRSRPRLPPHRRGQARQHPCVANVPSRWRLMSMESMGSLLRRTTCLRRPSPFANARCLLPQTRTRQSPVPQRCLPLQQQFKHLRCHRWRSPRTHRGQRRFHKTTANRALPTTPTVPRAMNPAAAVGATAAVVGARAALALGTMGVVRRKTWPWPAMSAWMRTTPP
jgi:hypothetical protein